MTSHLREYSRREAGKVCQGLDLKYDLLAGIAQEKDKQESSYLISTRSQLP